MDDLNYITQSLSSMLHAFHYTVKFGKASGLEVNFSKSSGMFVTVISEMFLVYLNYQESPGVRTLRY